ncbi:MAG: hypothetical protein GXY34_11205 [Syntrophomonadaceae bacterium]|nr:hypothetical protein [Syntrophomonadaceae bacterium]
MESAETNIGIGFITGRKTFKKVFRTYMNSFAQNGMLNGGINMTLFIAYDLDYTNTRLSDYMITDKEDMKHVRNIHYFGKKEIKEEVAFLTGSGVLTHKEAQLIFGEGYGKKRNIIMYNAIMSQMDYLLFIDDDEYPVAPSRQGNEPLIWRGQDIIKTHLHHIRDVDITNGYHCGYISPIPHIEYNYQISETDYQMYIEGLSNDILNWKSIKGKFEDGGVSYADEKLMEAGNSKEIEGVNAKFVSGSNLCINLGSNVENIPPFYNPPGARGEDTFFSTGLGGLKVLRVPCHAFHDGFQQYNCLLSGVLPLELMKENALVSANISRFLAASIGWARYKPLLLYITHRNEYEYLIKEARERLTIQVPKFCDYFHAQGFQMVLNEFEDYHKSVERHFESYVESKLSWKKLVAYAMSAHNTERMVDTQLGAI